MSNRTTCITYKIVQDLKGFTDRYKRDDWNTEERYFSSYLSVLDKLIKFYVSQNGNQKFSEEEIRKNVEAETDRAIAYLDQVARRSMKESNGTITINPGMEKVLIETVCKGNVAEFNKAMIYCVRRMGYITLDDENMAEKNIPLTGMKIWYARRNDSLKFKSKVGCDKYSVSHAIARINNVLSNDTKTSSKQLKLEKYLSNLTDVPGL